jgi:serine/threonine-protein kinase HipA
MYQFVHIFLWDEPLGIMARDSETNCGQFEFYPSFLKKGLEISPILYSMKNFMDKSLILRLEKPTDLPAFLIDVLPGHYAKDILRFALQNSLQTPEGLSSQSYLSLLGSRGFGAFSFEPSGYPELNPPEPIDIDLLVKYAHHLYNGGSGLSERRVRELLRSGLFTRGSWPKALVAINDFTGEVISGQGTIPEGFESWILKLDGVRNESSDALNVEYDFYKKAIDCGIDMVSCRILKDGHKKHLLCKRFDRIGNKKLHIQSFAALRDGIDDSYEAVFRCMRQLRLPYPDMEQMYKRLIFNVLIRNKNFIPEKIMFTYSQLGEWRLAPAFNLKPTPDPEVYSLSVCGKVKDILKEDLLYLGKKLNIKQTKSIFNTCIEVLEK